MKPFLEAVKATKFIGTGTTTIGGCRDTNPEHSNALVEAIA